MFFQGPPPMGGASNAPQNPQGGMMPPAMMNQLAQNNIVNGANGLAPGQMPMNPGMQGPNTQFPLNPMGQHMPPPGPQQPDDTQKMLQLLQMMRSQRNNPMTGMLSGMPQAPMGLRAAPFNNPQPMGSIGMMPTTNMGGQSGIT